MSFEPIVDNKEKASEHAVSSERQVGFLRMLEAVIKVLGDKLAGSVPIIVRIVASMLAQSHDYRQRHLTALSGGDSQEEGDKTLGYSENPDGEQDQNDNEETVDSGYGEQDGEPEGKRR